MKLCISDNHYTTAPRGGFIVNSKHISHLFLVFFIIDFEQVNISWDAGCQDFERFTHLGILFFNRKINAEEMTNMFVQKFWVLFSVLVETTFVKKQNNLQKCDVQILYYISIVYYNTFTMFYLYSKADIRESKKPRLYLIRYLRPGFNINTKTNIATPASGSLFNVYSFDHILIFEKTTMARRVI